MLCKQSDSVIRVCVCVYICTFFFTFFSIMVCHRILNIVPCVGWTSLSTAPQAYETGPDFRVWSRRLGEWAVNGHKLSRDWASRWVDLLGPIDSSPTGECCDQRRTQVGLSRGQVSGDVSLFLGPRSKSKTDGDFHSKRKDGESDKFGAKRTVTVSSTKHIIQM